MLRASGEVNVDAMKDVSGKAAYATAPAVVIPQSTVVEKEVASSERNFGEATEDVSVKAHAHRSRASITNPVSIPTEAVNEREVVVVRTVDCVTVCEVIAFVVPVVTARCALVPIPVTVYLVVDVLVLWVVVRVMTLVLVVLVLTTVDRMFVPEAETLVANPLLPVPPELLISEFVTFKDCTMLEDVGPASECVTAICELT